MNELNVSRVSKSFEIKKSTINVLKDIGFTVKNKEFLCILGKSGCGKTTLLRIIAGLLKPDSGNICLDKSIIRKPTRKIGLVFQEHACFPWLTVKENIAFGLKLQRKNKINKIVKYFINKINLKGFEDTYVNKLSSGMRQRVAVARTIANNPSVILMDEPFGSLDAQTRSSMQQFLLKLWKDNKKTVIFVTHDIDEAIFLSDRLVVLSQKPAKIIKEYKIKFKRPRNADLFGKKEYIKLKKEIKSLLI